MNYGYRYYIARVVSWAMLAMSALGLVFVASTATAGVTGRRIFGAILLFGGVVGGIVGAFVAIHSKVKQTDHEEQVGRKILNSYGEALRKEHAKTSAGTMPQKK